MDDIEENDTIPGVDIREMLELQLSEVEMLDSMFANPGEFQLDDKLAVAYVKDFLHGRLKYEYLHARLGFSVNLEPENSKIKLELVCNLPHEYPAVPPVVFTRSPNMSRSVHSRLNEDLNDFILNLDRGEICMYSVVEWLQENIDTYSCDSSVDETADSKVTAEDTVFIRLWIYSHHIYSKFKRRDILDWAEEMKLTGFSLPGKPGVICVEGYSRPVDEYWHRLRRQNWKRLMIKEKYEIDIGEDKIDTHRKFTSFEEIAFDVRGGKGREYHMDLGQFYDFLEKHDCGHVFYTYFGVEGKSASQVQSS